MSSTFQILSAVLLFATCIHAIPIDNGLEGEPEVECLGDSIQINFNARNPWEGNLYVKGLFADDGCKVTGTGANQLASIVLGFDSCNVQRQRSLEPRGVFVHATVVLSFHPIFMTKVDRAFRIQCFYMEADKTVSEELEVSPITTGFATMNVPMPVCRYDIRESADPESNPVQFALIGQSVYHHWICDTDTVDTFCMQVYDCKVDDGSGQRVIQLIDQDGCALDRNLLDNLDYPEDLRAVKESHVFKYADVPNTQYECQVAITVKDPGTECARPACGTAPAATRSTAVAPAAVAPAAVAPAAVAPGPGPISPVDAAAAAQAAEGVRAKRAAKQTREHDMGSMDVAPLKALFVADLDLTEEDVPAALLVHRAGPTAGNRSVAAGGGNQLCASSSAIVFVAALLVLAVTGTVTMVALMYARRQK